MEEDLFKDMDRQVVKLYVEIDVLVGLFDTLEISWRNKVQKQKLDYLGVSFRCSVCHNVGHLKDDFSGWSEEIKSSKDSADAYLEPDELDSVGFIVG